MDDTAKKIIAAPFRLAWGLTKVTGKIALAVGGVALDAIMKSAEDIQHVENRYDESGYDNDKLESIARDESRSATERIAAVKKLKERRGDN